MILLLCSLIYPKYTASTILTANMKGNECKALAGGIHSRLARSATGTRDPAAEREQPERSAEHVAGR